MIGSILYWILYTYYNSVEEENMNINSFLNKKITDIIFLFFLILVSIFLNATRGLYKLHKETINKQKNYFVS